MVQTITVQQAQSLISDGNVDVVDVRDCREWATGHIPGARLVPMDKLRSDLEHELPRDNVVFVCAKGARSLAAAKLAERMGLSQLYSIAGGTAGWLRAGMPLVHD
jgi:rhodanese-related sulfurtransferase